MNASWYDVLDVEPSASVDEIRTAWRSAVAGLDPTDRRFRVFNGSAEVLLDPAKRAAYDAELERERGRSDPAEPGRNDRSETEASLLARPNPRRSETEASLLARPHGWLSGLVNRTVPQAVTETDHPRALPVVSGWVIVAVALLTAVALGFVGVTLTKSSPASVESDTSAAQAAAERAIVPLLSYDAHHLDRSAAQATPYLTDSERQQYDKLFAVIRQNAPRTGTVVKAKYLASGIVRSGTDRVDVLVFVNQVTYNKQHPKTPVVYKNQATMTMAKVGNSWLVDNLTTNTAQS